MVVAGYLIPFSHEAGHVELRHRPVVYLGGIPALAAAQSQQGTQKNQNLFHVCIVLRFISHKYTKTNLIQKESKKNNTIHDE